MPLPVKIVGGGVIQQGVEQVVDPTFNAARVAIRPLDYQNLGQFLGHYSVAKNTGTTVSIGAGGTLAYLRWTDSSRYCVPLKVRVSAVVASAISTGTIVDVGLFQGHGSSGAGSGGNSVVPGTTNKARAAIMANSLVTEFRIATTAALTTPTGATVDAQAYAYAHLANSFALTNTFTNCVAPIIDLYKADATGEHPIVLSANDFLQVQEVTAGPTTGGIQFGFTFEWAEVSVF